MVLAWAKPAVVNDLYVDILIQGFSGLLGPVLVPHVPTSKKNVEEVVVLYRLLSLGHHGWKGHPSTSVFLNPLRHFTCNFCKFEIRTPSL